MLIRSATAAKVLTEVEMSLQQGEGLWRTVSNCVPGRNRTFSLQLRGLALSPLNHKDLRGLVLRMPYRAASQSGTSSTESPMTRVRRPMPRVSRRCRTSGLSRVEGALYR